MHRLAKLRQQGFWFVIWNHLLYRFLKQSRFRKRLSCGAPWLYGRTVGTDEWVFNQVFVFEEYGILGTGMEEITIIDGGANVGYTSVFLASRFPRAKIIAVEPDLDNFEVLRQNVANYNNITAVNGALWGTSGYISMSSTSYRDGGDWAKTVSPKEGSVRAYTITELLDQYGDNNPCVVKLDIEGAETNVFSENPHPWLTRCNMVIMEIHRDSEFGDPQPYIDRAMNSYDFAKELNGELVLYRKIRE